MENDLNQPLNTMYLKLLEGEDPDSAELENVLGILRAKKVIIYGAGRSGRMLQELFAKSGITPEFFVDRNFETIREIGKVTVRNPDLLASLGEAQDYVVVVGAGQMHLFELIVSDLDKINRNLARVCGVYLVYLLHYSQCLASTSRGEDQPPLKHCISYHVKPYKCPIFCRHVENLAKASGHVDSTKGSTFNDVGYLLGEVCTLNCEHCHEAVPYLNSTTRLPKETVIGDINKLVDSCSFLHRLDLVGGEPFAHPDIVEIVAEVSRNSKIGYIGVFTSGTSLPSVELCRVLKNDRIIVTVSDYSHNNNLTEKQVDKIHRTVEMLKEHDVNFIVIPDRYWFDMNGYEKGDVPEEKLKENFSHCFMAACHRIYDGTLYHCPYQAAGIKLGKLEKRDCIDIHEHTPEQLVAELDKFDKATLIDACRYCNLPMGPTEVIAGRQIERRVVRIHAVTE